MLGAGDRVLRRYSLAGYCSIDSVQLLLGGALDYRIILPDLVRKHDCGEPTLVCTCGNSMVAPSMKWTGEAEEAHFLRVCFLETRQPTAAVSREVREKKG